MRNQKSGDQERLRGVRAAAADQATTGRGVMEFRMGERGVFWTIRIILFVVGGLFGWFVLSPVVDWFLWAVGAR
jgi:hypothetical protein